VCVFSLFVFMFSRQTSLPFRSLFSFSKNNFKYFVFLFFKTIYKHLLALGFSSIDTALRRLYCAVVFSVLISVSFISSINVLAHLNSS
jgi:hypothetical protein